MQVKVHLIGTSLHDDGLTRCIIGKSGGGNGGDAVGSKSLSSFHRPLSGSVYLSVWRSQLLT